MKQYKFNVYFVGGDTGVETVKAGNPYEAVILAAAKRIKKGYHLQIFGVDNMDTGMKMAIDSNPGQSIKIGWIKS